MAAVGLSWAWRFVAAESRKASKLITATARILRVLLIVFIVVFGLVVLELLAICLAFIHARREETPNAERSYAGPLAPSGFSRR